MNDNKDFGLSFEYDAGTFSGKGNTLYRVGVVTLTAASRHPGARQKAIDDFVADIKLRLKSVIR